MAHWVYMGQDGTPFLFSSIEKYFGKPETIHKFS